MANNRYKQKPALTARQEKFCQEYLLDVDATQAALRAGATTKSAARYANECLKNERVRARIAELKGQRNAVLGVDADYVLQRLLDIDKMDIADILNGDLTVKPVHEWPETWRRYLSAVDIAELTAGRGDKKEIIGVLKKIKWPDKVKNLEMLGRHVNIQAFKDQAKTEFSGPDNGPVVIAELAPDDAAKHYKDLMR